jgi:hypothetical protein
VAKPTFNVAVTANCWVEPSAFAALPTILFGETIKFVTRHLSFKSVSADEGEVLNPKGAP